MKPLVTGDNDRILSSVPSGLHLLPAFQAGHPGSIAVARSPGQRVFPLEILDAKYARVR